MRIVILEGENKCGKTTLATQLVEQHGFKYVKCSQPNGDPYVEYMQVLKDIEESGEDTVIDRFVYGEFVYGPLYRGKPGMDDNQLRNIELKLLGMNALLIYCVDEAANIIERFRSENEEWAKEDMVAMTLNLYEDVIGSAIINTVRHRMKSAMDLTKGNSLNTILTIHFSGARPYLKTAIGNQRDPKLVLVGDKRNDKNDPLYGRYGQPFDFGPAAKHLFDEIYIAKVPLHEIMIINSDSQELGELARFDTVIALGANAATRLKKLNIRNIAVNHPSYERRFYYGQHRLADFFRSIYKGARHQDDARPTLAKE